MNNQKQIFHIDNDKKKILSIVSLVGYLLIGSLGFKSSVKQLTNYAKNKVMIREGQTVLKPVKIARLSLLKIGSFWVLYPIGLWYILDLVKYEKTRYDATIFDKISQQQKKNTKFQQQYLFDTLKYFKVSEKLTKKILYLNNSKKNQNNCKQIAQKINANDNQQNLQFIQEHIMEKNSYLNVTLSNRNRMKKRQKIRNIYDNQPKCYYKDLTCIQIQKQTSKFGYKFQDIKEKNMVLKRLKEQFQYKVLRIHGNKERFNKMGRIDKINANEKINSKIIINPLIKIFNNLQKNILRRCCYQSFQNIKKEAKSNKLIYN